MRSPLWKMLQRCRDRNLEVFWVSGAQAKQWRKETDDDYRAGWYWWSCSPGCLADGDPIGPFTSQTRAAEDALGDDF